MTDVAANTDAHAHDNEHHEHPAWVAHHFDDAQQQFDAGKLGMWVFLVTEVLFFSGMFCAYALFRSRNPEVFQFCSEFLNSKLGAINTGILLFSSFTMAWAVRAAQLRQNKLLVGLLGATLGCAAMFLGVKAVEYAHKWTIGLLPGRMYIAQLAENPYHSDVNYLGYIMIGPGILTVAAGLYWVYAVIVRNKFHLQVAGPLLVAGLCFFGGVKLGEILESGHGDDHHAAHAHAEGDSHGATVEDAVEHAANEATLAEIEHLPEGLGSALVSTSTQPLHDVFVRPAELQIPHPEVNNQGMAGLFFSVYYAMTGVHAVHIAAGMLVMVWLIVKAARAEFHSQYFGPVDNVGLYWHLVDFIWIYLFPLLYLIT